MISADFEPVYDNNNVLIKNVMTIRYNDKYVSSIDFPPETTMTQDEVDYYIAAKLSGLLN